MQQPAVQAVSPRKPGKLTGLALLGLLCLLFVLYFYRLGSYPLFDVDEPRYAEAAREMIERGDWITPYFNYELRFDKPVFFYWLIALAYQALGVGEFAARLVSALAASAMVLGVFCFGRWLVGLRFAWMSALVLASAAEVVGLARMSVTDMTLATLMTLTTLCLFLAAEKSPRWWLAAGVFSAMAVLTKGPVGLVVPGGILLIYALLLGQWRRVFFNRWFPLSLLLFVAVALPWYVLAYQANGQPFLDALFLHNMTRYSDVVSGHDQPVWFYAVVLAVGFLPWTPYLLPALAHWGKAWLGGRRGSDIASRIALFGAVWGVFVLVFFQVANTKLLTYILPMFPGLALLLAATFLQGDLQKDSPLARQLPRFAWALAVIALAGGLYITFNLGAVLPREARHIGEAGLTGWAVGVLVVGLIVAALALTRRRPMLAVAVQAATMGLVVVIGLHGIVPQVNAVTQGAMHRFLALSGQAPLATFEIRRPSLTFYARRRVAHVALDECDKLKALLAANGGLLYVITKNSFLEPLQTMTATLPGAARLSVIRREQRYTLLKLEVPAPALEGHSAR